ncbi:hypothetical protein Vadar_009335 [Vaccinium darrowii]|nr:hypothetical protein Vadar_009335 [Vaccinium darrowii]
MISDRIGLFSLFVDNLPDNVGLNWFRKFFSQYGVVKDAFIPFKRSKVTNQRFGFVRYICASSAELAISKANGFWIENRKLFVKMAAFEVQSIKPNSRGPLINTVSNLNLDKRSFADVVQHKTTPLVRYQKGVENSATIIVQPSGSSWLSSSAIVKMKVLSPPNLIKEAIFNVLKQEVEVKYMGGLFFIITCINEELRNNLIVNDVIRGWFSMLKPWNGETASLSRFVWLNCRGMPLNAWCLDSFKKIEDFWGDFLTLDDDTSNRESFEVGKLLMCTERVEPI